MTATQEELAARSREARAMNDRAVLAILAAVGDAGVMPGRELAERAGLPARTCARALGRLVDRGLARRDGKRRAWATDAGRSEAGAGAPGLALAPALEAAIDCLPAEALRAFARLQLAAVPARWHLASQYPSGWTGFIALGPTKTGKTSTAQLVCRVYGLEEVRTIKVAQHETPGSLFARRHREPGGYRVERSPLLELPYACVDEWDKAPAQLRAASGALLLGNASAELEGERIAIRPTVYVTLNTGRRGLEELQEAHVRRSVVLDTAPLRPLLADLDEEIARLFTQTPIPRLALGRIRPPASSLSAPLRKLLRAALRAGLTDEGWQSADVEPLARVVLGRAALTDGPLEQAALATAFDYLTCAATLGQTRHGYAAELAPRLDPGALVPDPAAAQQQRHELEAQRRRRQRVLAAEHDALIEARGELAQRLSDTIAALELRRLPLSAAAPAVRAQAKGLSEQLAALRAETRQARTKGAISLVNDRVAGPLDRAQALLGQATSEVERKQRLTQRLRRARALGRIPAPHHQTAAELRSELDGLLHELPTAYRKKLAELERRAERPLAQALALPGQIKRERERQRLQATAERQSAVQTRARLEQAARADRERRQRERQAASRERRAVDTAIRKLEQLAKRTTTRAEERPLEQLLELRILGGQPVIFFERDERPESPGGRLLYAIEAASGYSGTWRSPWDPTLALAGSEHACEQLADWQAPATQRALAAALAQLRTHRAAIAPLTRSPGSNSPRRARAPANRSQRAAPNQKRRAAAQRPPQPELVRCPQCGILYRRRTVLSPLLGPVSFCPSCNQQLEPV